MNADSRLSSILASTLAIRIGNQRCPTDGTVTDSQDWKSYPTWSASTSWTGWTIRTGLRSRWRRFESCRGRPCDVARHQRLCREKPQTPSSGRCLAAPRDRLTSDLEREDRVREALALLPAGDRNPSTAAPTDYVEGLVLDEP